MAAMAAMATMAGRGPMDRNATKTIQHHPRLQTWQELRVWVSEILTYTYK